MSIWRGSLWRRSFNCDGYPFGVGPFGVGPLGVKFMDCCPCLYSLNHVAVVAEWSEVRDSVYTHFFYKHHSIWVQSLMLIFFLSFFRVLMLILLSINA